MRQRGIDVTTAAEMGLLGADDDMHIQFAYSESRIVVTHDEDFLRRASHGILHAGVAYCHQRTHTIGEIVRYLELMTDCLAPEEMMGKVEFI